MNKTYDYKELIRVYIETQVKHPPDLPAEILNYYPLLLSHLESAFEVNISLEAVRKSENRVLFKLFGSTVYSYIKQSNPWSDYLEAGLLVRKLENLGTTGERVLETGDKIRELVETSKKEHLEMLYMLFEIMYGKNDKVVNSAQLLDIGFDDSNEPDFFIFM